MKTIFVVALLVALCAGAPQQDPKDAVILEHSFDNIGVGPWSWGFRSSDGIARQETGVINNAGTENEAIQVRGSITWIGHDGQSYTVNYVADENGFQPEGVHLPKK